MLDDLNPYFWHLRVAAAAAAVVASFSAGWIAQGWRKDAAISDMERATVQAEASALGRDIVGLQKAASAVQAAASGAIADNTATVRELRAIRQEMKNAKPLPPDCRPDAERLRQRNAAIEAYNRAAAGSVSGRAVQEP